MALNSEDKQDVQRHYGKAFANKVSKATRDYAKGSKYSAKEIKEARAKTMYDPKRDGVYKHRPGVFALGDERNPKSYQSRTRIN